MQFSERSFYGQYTTLRVRALLACFAALLFTLFGRLLFLEREGKDSSFLTRLACVWSFFAFLGGFSRSCMFGGGGGGEGPSEGCKEGI